MEFSNNHTVFYEDAKKAGTGVAFSLEDDYARLILNAVSNNGLVEIFSPSSVRYSLEMISSGRCQPPPCASSNAGRMMVWNGILSFPWT